MGSPETCTGPFDNKNSNKIKEFNSYFKIAVEVRSAIYLGGVPNKYDGMKNTAKSYQYG